MNRHACFLALLVLVLVAGAELFTGNNLLVMAWACHRITTTELLRDWLIVYFANLVGALGLVWLGFLSDHFNDRRRYGWVFGAERGFEQRSS